MPTLSAVLAVVRGVLAVAGALSLGEVLDADTLVLAWFVVTLHPAAGNHPGADNVCGEHQGYSYYFIMFLLLERLEGERVSTVI